MNGDMSAADGGEQGFDNLQLDLIVRVDALSVWLEIRVFLGGILMEHIYLKCSRESKLFFISLCSLTIRTRTRDIDRFFKLQISDHVS